MAYFASVISTHATTPLAKAASAAVLSTSDTLAVNAS